MLSGTPTKFVLWIKTEECVSTRHYTTREALERAGINACDQIGASVRAYDGEDLILWNVDDDAEIVD